MSKVLNSLVRAGVVTSQRGPSGGFLMARRPEEVTMFDIVTALEPFPRIERCPLSLPEHSDHLCSLHATLDGLAQVAEETLKSKTLAALLRPSVGRGECEFCTSRACQNRCGALQVRTVALGLQQPASQRAKKAITSSPSVPPDPSKSA